MFRHIISLILAFSICSTLLGQIEQLKFDHLTIRDGLSDDIVTSIIQDKQGFIWFGTYRGVCRYDGKSFTCYQYDENDSTSLGHNVVTSLYQDNSGKIWVGSTAYGISILDPATNHFERISGGEPDEFLISNNSIICIYEDSNYNMWIGTEFGLTKISPDRKTSTKFYCKPENCIGLSAKKIYDIVEDETRVWFATDRSYLSYYDKLHGTFHKVGYTDIDLQFEDSLFKNFYYQGDSVLWIGSNTGGLSMVDTRTLSYKTYFIQNEKNDPTSIQIRDIIYNDGKLWLATDGKGLNIFDIESESFINHLHIREEEASLSTNSLWSIFKDKQDIIWIGTYAGGVNIYDPSNNYFQLYELEDKELNYQIANVPILSIHEDRDENLWIGTDWGGLFYISNVDDSAYRLTAPDVLSTDVVKTLSMTDDDHLIIGTYNQGITDYDINTKASTHHPLGDSMTIPTKNVWAVYSDSHGINWIGTLGAGVAMYNVASQTFERVIVDYPDNRYMHVYHIFEDSQSNMWFSTDGGLLYYYRRTNEWRPIDPEELYPTRNQEVEEIRAVAEDRLGHIWIASAAGLIKFYPETNNSRFFDLANGLPQLPLLGLEYDNYGNLIITSRTYITQFDLAKESVVSYQINDNSFTYNTTLTRKNGQILVGGTSGITQFDPRDLRKNEYVPPVFITHYKLFGDRQDRELNHQPEYRDLLDSRHIDLYPEHSMIQLRFAALNYSESNRNQYSYRLRGYDDKWHNVGNHLEATYTNLDPGKYVFEVKAANNHGLWNQQGDSLTVIVHPPFWKTRWFILMILIALITVVYFIYKFRINQLKKSYSIKQLKSEREVMKLKSSNLSKELESAKSEINNITMSYLHKNQKLQKVRKEILDIAVRISDGERRRINNVIKEIDKEIEDHDYWDKFEHQFDKSHDNFLERFKKEYPDLSKRELRLCAYLRMGLSNQDISTLMNVTVRTVEQSRYRVRKKIKLEERQSFIKMILRF